MSTTLKKQLSKKFWLEFSNIFTENIDEKYFDFFFQLQDVFDIQSDDEDEYCQEMANWSKEKQQVFLNDCFTILKDYDKNKVVKLIDKY
jgi:hypothetical protein